MFDQLPETKPLKNKRKLQTFVGSLVLQIALVAGFVVLQMAMPEKLGEFHLLTTLYMAPPPPPPPAPLAAAPEPVRRAAPKAATATANRPEPVVVETPKPLEREPEVVSPTAIPRDIARIVESSGAPSGGNGGGVPGGVPGGIPGGVPGGLGGGVLGGAAQPPVLPPPTEPVRVGGNVKPPKLIHVEQPAYPPAAKKAGIEGVVVVEAVVTADGSVDKVKVISGPPLLLDSATAAVAKWKYEPTFLNGQAVPVILTARINFSLANAQK
jgi:periplasmic protein TonB